MVLEILRGFEKFGMKISRPSKIPPVKICSSKKIESMRRIFFSLYSKFLRERETFIALFEMECEWDR